MLTIGRAGPLSQSAYRQKRELKMTELKTRHLLSSLRDSQGGPRSGSPTIDLNARAIDPADAISLRGSQGSAESVHPYLF